MILSYKDYIITGTPQEIKEFIDILDTTSVTTNWITPNISDNIEVYIGDKDVNGGSTQSNGKNGKLTAEEAYNKYIKPMLRGDHIYKYAGRDDAELEEELKHQEEPYANSSIEGQMKNSLRNKKRIK